MIVKNYAGHHTIFTTAFHSTLSSIDARSEHSDQQRLRYCLSFNDYARCRGDSNRSSPQGMHNLAVGNAHGSEAPGKRPTPKGSHPGGGRPATLSGFGLGRGSGTRRALPDATFCGPFRAKTLRRGGADSYDADLCHEVQHWHSNFPARQSAPQGAINHKSAIQRPCHSTGRAS